MTKKQDKTKETKKKEFIRKYCSNRGVKIRWLRSIFVDDEEKINTILEYFSAIEKEAYNRGKDAGQTEEAIRCDTHCKEAYKRGKNEVQVDVRREFYQMGYDEGLKDAKPVVLQEIEEKMKGMIKLIPSGRKFDVLSLINSVLSFINSMKS